MKHKTAYIIAGAGLLALSIGVALAAFVNRKKIQATVTKWLSPITGRITSPFANRVHPITGVYGPHNGIDISMPEGTPIYAPESGTVKSVYYNSTGGNQLIISHDNGYQTGYAHLKKSVVSVGDKVKRGQKIAESGNTGASTAAHLHLTMKDSAGNYVDPQKQFS